MTSDQPSSIDIYRTTEGVKVTVALSRHDRDVLLEHGEVVINEPDAPEQDGVAVTSVTIQA